MSMVRAGAPSGAGVGDASGAGYSDSEESDGAGAAAPPGLSVVGAVGRILRRIRRLRGSSLSPTPAVWRRRRGGRASRRFPKPPMWGGARSRGWWTLKGRGRRGASGRCRVGCFGWTRLRSGGGISIMTVLYDGEKGYAPGMLPGRSKTVSCSGSSGTKAPPRGRAWRWSSPTGPPLQGHRTVLAEGATCPGPVPCRPLVRLLPGSAPPEPATPSPRAWCFPPPVKRPPCLTPEFWVCCHRAGGRAGGGLSGLNNVSIFLGYFAGG